MTFVDTGFLTAIRDEPGVQYHNALYLRGVLDAFHVAAGNPADSGHGGSIVHSSFVFLSRTASGNCLASGNKAAQGDDIRVVAKKIGGDLNTMS